MCQPTQQRRGAALSLFVPAAILALAAALLAPPPGLAQEGETGNSAEANGESAAGKGKRDEDGIKPYRDVIPEDALSDDGVFTTHRVGDKLYYEIPASELDAEFLLVTRIAKSPIGLGYGGQKLGSRVVRWQRFQDHILLRSVSYEIVADRELPIAQAVAAANHDAIVMAFDVAAESDGGAAVIEVTPLFASEVTELSARPRLQARGFDKKRSFIDRVMAFPRNIEVRALHTYTRPAESDSSGRGRPSPPRRFSRAMDPGSATVEVAFSMIKLPEKPMMPRLFDERVGFFSVRQVDYGTGEHRAAERRYITRWRLEKQNPKAEVSEPVQPIVYWIDPATPRKWVPYVKQGVEDWQPAFEEAGFRRAILAREAPSYEEDPEWSAEDSRYSVIRWLPSEIENASGPHVHDPRTGEILESDIQFYHNVQNLVRDWYFVQVAPVDPRAQDLPLPDELMGELLRYVVAHEVGHTLGFQHNMKASSTYPFEKLRDPAWLAEMGHTPTLMDYSRFNYLVQPGDGVDPADLIPGIGPYDRWATMWGYRPIPEAGSPDEERPTLDRWARAQDETPWLRFSTAGARGADPGELTEAVGDADAVAATTLGLANLERVVDLLLPATSEPGRNWDDLEELYGRVLGQWVREMNHVAAIVGGYRSREVHAGQEGVRFEPVPADEQRRAVAFLNRHAFRTPEILIRPEITRRIEAQGVAARIAGIQRSVLGFLLQPARFVRLAEQSALAADRGYEPAQLIADLRHGLWDELDERRVAVGPFRRETQRLYLDLLDERLNGGEEIPGEMRAALRGDLREVRTLLAAAMPRSVDEPTRLHVADSLARVAEILEPRFPRARSGGANSGQRGASESSVPFDPTVDRGCWVEEPPPG